jgi:hypothetical protein
MGGESVASFSVRSWAVLCRRRLRRGRSMAEAAMADLAAAIQYSLLVDDPRPSASKSSSSYTCLYFDKRVDGSTVMSSSRSAIIW